MTFWRRLRIYLVGVGLGLLIVYIIFGDRKLNTWTPQQRVLTAIDSSQLIISEKASCQLNCLNIVQSQLRQIQQLASVDFSESYTQKKPCPVYHLNSLYENKNYLLLWEVCEKAEQVKLLSISRDGSRCNCN